MAYLKGIFFSAQFIRDLSPTLPLFLFSIFFFFLFCGLIVWLSAREGRALSLTLSPGAERRLCKLFLPEQKTCSSSFSDMAGVTIIRFTRRGTHTGCFFFFFSAEQHLVSSQKAAACWR